MRHKRVYWLFGVAIVLACGRIVFHDFSRPSVDPTWTALEVKRTGLEPAPPCPWREPEIDLKAFFPGATRTDDEVRILSASMFELAQRLRRQPSSDELRLLIHRVYVQQEHLGDILTRRVKGEFGVIEVVVAVTPNGAIRGIRLQRLREPTTVREAIEAPGWLQAFEGKSATSAWQLGQDIPEVPRVARVSAEAIVNGVRCLLILLDTSQRSSVPHAHAQH